ncbi:MAG: hypothetical protein AMXMBFR60_29970 [Chloroflexota bacterium]
MPAPAPVAPAPARAEVVNGLQRGRKTWWNYWDTCLTSEREFYARLRYVFWNPVKYGLCDSPEDYAFSNYKEFMANWQVEFNFTDMEEVEDVPEF